MYSQKGSPSKNLSGTGIFSRCPLWSFLPTARCKQKNSQSKGLYLSKNNTRLSHWRGLALSPQPKERRGGFSKSVTPVTHHPLHTCIRPVLELITSYGYDQMSACGRPLAGLNGSSW